MVWPRALLACAVLALILICASANIPKPTPDAHGRIPFDVYFDTSAPLGLRFDSSLIVVGFSMIDNKPSPAETARWIAPGDTLVAVNGVDVTGIGLQRAVLAIRDAALPKVLTFVPHKPGEDRAADMQKLVEESVYTANFTGVFELAVLGTHEDTEAESFPFAIARHATGRHHRRVLAFSFPVLMAHFGTVTSCHKVKVVAGEPAHGCGAFTNAHHISNAAVVLTRGECQFADKAHNVETADGAVMIVINDAGPAIRMPISEGDSVNVPSVMLSKSDGDAVLSILKAAAKLPFADVMGRVVMFNQVCKEGFYPSGEHSDEERELGGHEAAAADGRSLKDGSIVLEDGTKIDAEAAGTFALGYVASAGQQSADVGVDGSLDSEGNATPSTILGNEYGRFEYVAADFGDSFLEALKHPRAVVFADPPNACGGLHNTASEVADAVVIVERGTCTFEEKASSVSVAGGVAMVLINHEPTAFAMPSTGTFTPRKLSSATAAAAAGDSYEANTGADQPAAVMVAKGVGSEVLAALAKAASEGKQLYVGDVKAKALVRKYWEEVDKLLDHKQWPTDPHKRRKLYFKASMHHHPDKPEGNKARFEAFNYAYRRANHRYDPDAFEFVDDLE